MSAEAVRTLKLNVIYNASSADAASKKHHAQEAARIKATAAEQAKADADYERAILKHLAAEKQLDQEKLRNIREEARERERLNLHLNALLKSSVRDEERLAKEAAREKIRADRDAFRNWKLGADQKHREAMQAWNEEQDAIKDNESELSKLVKTGLSLAAVYKVAGSIGDEFRRAYEHVRKTAEEFADLRKAMVQVAALRGEQPTDKFTAQQAKTAFSAGLTPQEWVKAQEAFLNPAGAQVGNQPGAKMTDAEAEQYEKRVAAITAAKLGGENAGLGMEFAGSILEQSRGHLTPDQAMAKFNPAFEGLQKGRIDLRRAMPMMSQIMAHGYSPTEAMVLLNTVAPAAPGEEATHVEAATRAIEKMRVAGKGQEFSVTDKMTPYEAIKTFSKNVAAREAALRAKGLSEEEAEVEIAKQLKKAGVAARIEEQRGLIRGMVRYGVKLHGFETFEGFARETPADYDLRTVEAFRRSHEGKAAMERARKAAIEAEQGYQEQPVKQVLDEAENIARANRLFMQARGNMIYRGTIGIGTGVESEKQITNEQALGMLRNRAYYKFGITGDSHLGTFGTGGQFQVGRGGIETGDVIYRTQQSVNDEIRELLKLIADATQKQAKSLEKWVQANPAAVGAGVAPLVALPIARGNGVR